MEGPRGEMTHVAASPTVVTFLTKEGKFFTTENVVAAVGMGVGL